MGEAPEAAARPTAGVHSARIFCEVCGEETDHRILRIDPRGPGRPGQGLEGVARCRVCHWTHPFRAPADASVEVDGVVSDGRTSRAERIRLSPTERVTQGSDLPGTAEPPLRVHRIDRPDGRRVSSALPNEIATLWLVPFRGDRVNVSIIEGRRTRTTKWTAEPGARLEVGGTLPIDGEGLRIVGLRARGRTWKVPGDAFPATEVDRIYARRNSMPPAGRSPWSRDRASPSSRARAISRSPRSRSSPGVMRKRT